MRERTDLALLLACAASTACSNTPAPRSDCDDVRVGSALAARYVHQPYDAARVRETCKVWHELFAPDGRRITKGLGGEFEHHRGLFLAFHKTTHDGRTLDFWHCRNGETQRHVGFWDPTELGLDSGFQVVAIDWTDAEGKAVVRERRALRAQAIDARTWRYDFVAELRADEPVSLSGDPHHSGCQFRALAEFSEKGGKKVVYIRPPGAVAHANDEWTGCSWMTLPLDGEPVTVLRVELPGNPTPVRWSSRDYGRFGSTFAHALQPGAPLRIGYAWVVALGALDDARCAQLAAQVTAADGSGSGTVRVR
jgi:Methane oxygenase PmoA